MWDLVRRERKRWGGGEVEGDVCELSHYERWKEKRSPLI